MKRERKVLGTYRFKDKDPIIDLIRTCVEIYATLRGVPFWVACKQLSGTSGVSLGCMKGWFLGRTISPIFQNAAAVVRATGKPIRVGDTYILGRPRPPEKEKKAA